MQQRRGTAQQWTDANPILAAGEIGFETDTGKFKMGNGSSAWSALSYFADAQDFDSSNLIALSQKGAVNGVATLDATGNVPVSQLGKVIATAPALLDTLAELASAVNSDPNFSVTVENAITAATTGAASALSTHNSETQNVHGIANTALLATTTDVDNAETSAITNANSYTDGRETAITLAYEAYADASEADAKAYADTEIANAIVTANTYTDEEVGNGVTLANAYTDAKEITITAAYENYANTVAESEAGAAETAAIAAANAYTDTEILTLDTSLQAYVGQEVTAAINAHIAVTENIHGIADTSALETVGGSQDKADAAENAAVATAALDAEAKADAAQAAAESYADSAISTHNTDTTNVHGIADTSLLATTANVATAKQEAIDLAAVASELYTDAAILALDKTSVGLGNVDNTSDANKPVSTAQATAIATAKSEAIADATSQINAVIASAPAALNTLDELAAALNDDANFATTVTNSLAEKAPLASPTFTGTVTVSASGVAFTDGTQTKEGVPSRTPIIQKTAAYTLSSLSERDNLVEVNSSSAVTVTIPTNASVAYPVGTSIDILQTGSGQVTIAGAAGVTVNSTPGLKLRTQWSSATLFKRAENTWVVFGDLSA